MKIIYRSLQNLFRNIGPNSAILVIFILMFILISGLAGINFTLKQAIERIREKADLSIYLKPDVSESITKSLISDLNSLSNIKRVEIVSPEESLKRFKKRHINDPIIMESFKEINRNPFGPMILIQTKQGASLDSILEIVDSPRYEDVIQDKDIENYQQIINLIDYFGRKIKYVGLVISGIFILIAILIVFNVVRLNIYNREKEIKIMRLVGARASFIRLPFLLEVFFDVFFAWLIAIGMFLLTVYYFQPHINTFLGFQLNFFNYLLSNFLPFFGLQLVFAILLCYFSTSISLKKYLKF